MRDIDVRKALSKNVACEYSGDSDVRVIHELGVRHGTARIDLAVINGKMIGYEIKSDSDTLKRLPCQIEYYNQVFDKVTLVVGCKHHEEAVKILPEWWGVCVAITNDDGNVVLEKVKPATQNILQNPTAIAELLWKEEVVSHLKEVGYSNKELRKPRAHLYSELSSIMEIDDLKNLVRSTLKHRENWRPI